MPKKRQITILFSTLLILSLGCGPLGQMAATQSSGQTAVSPASTTAPGASKGPSTPLSTPAGGNTEEPLAIPGVYPAELTAPFPPPLPLSGGSPDDNAATLAKAVLADDQDSFAALLAAFEESGIAICAADGGLANKPAEPWQGLIYEAWEMRLLFNMVRKENFVTINLVDLTDTLRSVIPELDKAPLAQLLLDDLRAYAQSDQPTMRFWARFIVELGRQAQAHPSYDLLGQVDPAGVNLDGIQTSLILQRLAVDMLIFANAQSTAMETNKPEQVIFRLPEPVSDDSRAPCTFNSTAKTIMDVVAFGSKLGYKLGMGGVKVFDTVIWKGLYTYLEDNGLKGSQMAGKALGYASIIQSYEKFIYTYVMLKVIITIDKEPLLRTKEMRPKSGANQKLTALVKMDGGNFQAVNCLRIISNLVGTDLNVPQNGVLKGAHVAWDGRDGFNQAAAAVHGGPDQIVRLSSTSSQQGGDPSTGINPITNQITDDEGKAYIGVEGVGQPKKVPDIAKQDVKKSATVGMQVAVKGGDIFKDLIGAGMQSMGGVKSLLTMPTEILYRMKWATSGSLTFSVLDWSKGWKVDFTGTVWNTPNTRFAGLSCGSPYGPWEIYYKGVNGGGGAEAHGTFHVPFAENGKVTATFEDEGTAVGGLDTFKRVGTFYPTITQADENYRIDFGPMTYVLTGKGGGVAIGPITQTVPGFVFEIIPAEGDDCSQP